MTPDRTRPRARLTLLACASYTGNCAVGAAVASGAVRRGRIGWVHHLLFISTVLLTTTAIATRSHGSRYLYPTVVPLTVLPRTNTRTAAHPLVGLSAAPFYIAAFIASRR